CHEIAASDSFDRPDSGGRVGGADPDAPPFPHQAATMELQWSWTEDARQRPIPLRGRAVATFQETAAASWTESRSQPRSQENLQGCSHHGQHLRWTVPRILRGF